MDTTYTPSLHVSLHAADDLRRSLDSTSRLGSSLRTNSVDSRADRFLNTHRSSGVGSSDSVDSSTWPRSSVHFYGRQTDTFRLSSNGSGSCLLHGHKDGAEICPFDGSKYRLAPFSRLSLSSSSVNRKTMPIDQSVSSSLIPKIDTNASRIWDEINRIDNDHGSISGTDLNSTEMTEDFGNVVNTLMADTKLNGDLWRPFYSRDQPEMSPVGKMSSCKFMECASSIRRSFSSYGQLSSSNKKFPSRLSLKSTGSNENLASTSNNSINNINTTNFAFNSGSIFRKELEAKYEHYKETYLTTSPEQELRTLNAAIVNVRKWLRKRHEALKNLTAVPDTDSNKQIVGQDVVKKLVAEARKQQEGVDILLDRGQRFLSQRANIVLEVDLENLVFLWNCYVEGLRKIYAPSHREDKVTAGSGGLEEVDKNCTETAVPSRDKNLEDSVSNISSQKDYTEVNTTKNSNSIEFPSAEPNQISVEDTQRKSGSSGSNCSINASNDLSFEDSGTLTLEDLKTHTTALDIKELSGCDQISSSDQQGEHSSHDYFDLHAEGSQAGERADSVENESQSVLCVFEASSDEEESPISLEESVQAGSASIEKMDMEASEKSLLQAGKGLGEASNHIELSTPGKSSSASLPPSESSDKKNASMSTNDARSDVGALITFDIPGLKVTEAMGGDIRSEAKRRRMLLDTPINTSNLSSRSESPISFNSSRSETPTGTLTRAERQNELWKAIGCIDPFLMDKDIVEACKSTASDLSCEDEDFVGTPNVSFAEFLQQYKELTDWVNQVHKVTQREVTSFSEKYLNQSYHEEMLERSPRREFLNNYSRQLLLRYPNMAEQISARMNRLNAQWSDLEQAIAPKHGKHDADTMLQDLECDLNTLRRWLNAIEARLLPLTIKADWTDAELEERLQKHQALQRDIESHNKIVNAVLKLSDRLEHDSQACGTEKDKDSLQLVALNLERRWHGIWLQSLEWQCRLEEAISRRKGIYQSGFDFSGFSLPVLDESLLGQCRDINDHGLIELDDDSLLFIGHRDDFADNTGDGCRNLELISRSSSSASESNSFVYHAGSDVEFEGLDDSRFGVAQDNLTGSSQSKGTASSGASTPTSLKSPERPSAFCKPDSPLGKRPFPGIASGEASPAKRGSQSPSSSSGGVSPISHESPLDLFINSRGLHVNNKGGLLINSIQTDDDQIGLKIRKSLFDRSSGDSANISEAESKMGESPPTNNVLISHPAGPGGYAITSSDGEIDPPAVRVVSKSEVKDIGYSSESQSNDEVDAMRHQIDMEYKYPGKCEVASDGPLGEKVSLPPVTARRDYYNITLVDIDSTDKTDNGDTTDSGGERVKKMQERKGSVQSQDTSQPEADKFQISLRDFQSELDGNLDSDSLEDSWDGVPSSVAIKGHYNEHLYEGSVPDQSGLKDGDMKPMHQLVDFSESDSAPESKGKKSIRYLIDHAEDLVKSPSPKSSAPSSPTKIQPFAQPSPSKQTQTDSCCTVESSCDASGEDNSDHEGVKPGSAREEFSTATDDADDTLFGSVVNLDSATESARNASTDDITSPSPPVPSVYDSPRLRKQTGGKCHRRGKKDRPWSVVGLQDDNTSKKNDSLQQIIAASESAINHIHCHTDTDSPSSFLLSSNSSTFPRENRNGNLQRALSSSDQTSSLKSAKRKLKLASQHKISASSTPTTSSGSHIEDSKTSEGSTSIINSIANLTSTTRLPYSETSSGTDRSPRKNRRNRRRRRRSSIEKKESSSPAHARSSNTDSYDSAEAESESETTDEYLTAPMEVATSDGDDVHNVSGSLSENSTWDNYQMIYPTASEDPGEELLTWDPQDELEFDDDFQLGKQKRSLVSDVMSGGQQRTKLKFTKQGMLRDDSDSDLEDFHDILDQSEHQLKLADQSLRKKRKDPMSTGLHPNPAKYSDIIATYETNIRCLRTICQHLKSENVPEQDVQRVDDLMYQWEKLYALASERFTQASDLGAIQDKLAAMKTCVQEAGDCLPFDRFSSVQELKETIDLLKAKRTALELQGKQLEGLRKQLTDFSILHPTINVDKYLKEMSSVQKSTTFMTSKVTEHVNHLENNWSVWLEYLDSQAELDTLLSADRERLHNLLCQREHGIRITKKDVLRELETLQTNLSVYESKLAILQAMRTRLTKTSDHAAQKLLLASVADLRNQLLVVTERCRQFYRDVEEDDDVQLDQQCDLGKLAVSAAALHEVFKKPAAARSSELAQATAASSGTTNTGLTRSCASWLRSLPVQVVALMMVAGLVYALDPDILERLNNFTITVTPEVVHVNGPPPT